MNPNNFKTDEFINQFVAKLEAENASTAEIRAFHLGVLAATSSIHDLIKIGLDTTELSTVCSEFGTALEGGSDA